MARILWHKFGVLFIVTLIAATIAAFHFATHTHLIDQLQFTETTQDVNLVPYHDKVRDLYYLFVPAYTSPHTVVVDMPKGYKCHFGTYGTTLAALPVDTVLTLTVRYLWHREQYCFKLMQSAHVNTLFLETRSGALQAVEKKERQRTQVALLAIDEAGRRTYCDVCQLVGRGNTTYKKFDKKPYNLRFKEPVKLFDSADVAADTWCLLANARDDSRLRNAVSLFVARSMGIPYTSDQQFVSLYVNGEYRGLYDITTKQNHTQDAYVVAFFERANPWLKHHYVSKNGSYLRYRAGDELFVRNQFEAFEQTLYDANSRAEQLAQHINIPSFALKYYMELFVGNYDIHSSQYYTIGQDSLIAMACAWDYDISMGMGFLYPDILPNTIFQSNSWYNALNKHKGFRDEVRQIHTTIGDSLRWLACHYVDSVAEIIHTEWHNDRERWQNFNPGAYHFKNHDFDYTTLQGHCDFIKQFLGRRSAFLGDYLNAPECYHSLTLRIAQRESPIALYYKHGDTISLEKLPAGLFEDTQIGFEGYYDKNGHTLQELTQLNEDVYYDKRLNQQKTALKEVAKLGISSLGFFVFLALVIYSIMLIIKSFRS